MTNRSVRLATFFHLTTALLLSSLVPGEMEAQHVLGTPSYQNSLEVVVNLPARRLDVFQNGINTVSYPVAIGARGFPTPRGSHQVTQLIWNPSWNPPASRWARGQKPMGPGPNNPMGRVKILLRGLYYIHGSPAEESIGHPASHGCIRMRNEDAIALATLLSQHTGGLSEEEIGEILSNNRRTRHSRLPEAVPTHIVYETAELKDGDLLLHPDVYNREEGDLAAQAERVLRAAGYDETHWGAEGLRFDFIDNNSSHRIPLADILNSSEPREAILMP